MNYTKLHRWDTLNHKSWNFTSVYSDAIRDKYRLLEGARVRTMIPSAGCKWSCNGFPVWIESKMRFIIFVINILRLAKQRNECFKTFVKRNSKVFDTYRKECDCKIGFMEIDIANYHVWLHHSDISYEWSEWRPKHIKSDNKYELLCNLGKDCKQQKGYGKIRTLNCQNW